ncbi:anti-sigma regulatory factor (Ser/Thr protein kinase) [Streptomyces sp. 846.5]|nr:ATP-binding protein [Streptomyces sp. 846.5]TDU04181.1 anti-sigma regulatory factor (Ser/Thr protein kinase) [Streptomyces sp. 846.5]
MTPHPPAALAATTPARTWHRDYPLTPASAHRARADAAAFLHGHHLPAELLDDTLLVLSELVTNAIRHAHAPGRRTLVHLTAKESTVRIEVSDPNPRPPAQLAPTIDEENHRGLFIVRTLATDWGIQPRPVIGKTIWAVQHAT